MIPKASIKRYYRINRRDVYFLKFILEGYSGVAVMRTLDPQNGFIVLYVSPGCEKEVDMILNDLKGQIRIEKAELIEREGL